ncbi:hypothetical protein NADFUDRAFT_14076, partial [Nadsonia fulvescens var. elongata DSM 6958]
SYGFVGLGRMGYPMATNLLHKLNIPSDHLTIYDLNQQSLESFSSLSQTSGLEKSVSIAHSLNEIAQCDIVISMLPLPKHVEQTYKTIVSYLSQQPDCQARLFIDCSTIDPMTSNRVAATMPTETSFVDAPVSGGVVGATNATLTFMVGASTLTTDLETTLKKLGTKVVSCGPQGSGLVAKLANNYLLAVCNIATCEAFHLASKAGLDLATFAAIVNSSSGANWSSIVNNPVPGIVTTAPAGRAYDNGFGIGLMKKDIGLCEELANQTGVKFLLADRVNAIYNKLEADQNLKNKDLSVVYKYLHDHE